MKVKSMRIPEDIDQAINYVSQLEKIEKTQSLRKLARLGFEYYVAKNYRDGRISLRNAADLLNLNLSETIDLLAEAGVKGNIRASDVIASLNSISPQDLWKLHYKSLSEYVREAVNAKVEKDRKKLRELKRKAAIEMIGKAPYDNVFESIEGEDFEIRWNLFG